MNIEDYVPASILALQTEANLAIVNPHFAASLAIPGDVIEVGCFRGTMSLKYAFLVAALSRNALASPYHLPKTIYALDTFEGFKIADTDLAGGARRPGDYNAGDGAYQELRKWSKIIPIVPLRCDATTVDIPAITASFIWFDLDIASLLDGALRNLDRLISQATIIGLDDYGRPDCPTVKPWADELERAGYWKKTFGNFGAHIAFYKRTRNY